MRKSCAMDWILNRSNVLVLAGVHVVPFGDTGVYVDWDILTLRSQGAVEDDASGNPVG